MIDFAFLDPLTFNEAQFTENNFYFTQCPYSFQVIRSVQNFLINFILVWVNMKVSNDFQQIMNSKSSAVILLVYFIVLCTLIKGNPTTNGLILTPLIENGNISLAQNYARINSLIHFSNTQVSNIKYLNSIEAYSGYITVNTKCNSNLFFVFIPAQNQDPDAPVILWFGGGPGSSGMLALFVEHGPYELTKTGTLRQRYYAWTSTRSVIYLDSPVGTGFSYTDYKTCFARSSKQVGSQVLEFLVQFYQLFPQFKPNQLYIASGSYGGKFAPVAAYEIHRYNQRSVSSELINLEGIFVGGGFMDPINQIDYGEFYYNIGIIDENEKKVFNDAEELGKSYIKSSKWDKAFEVIEPLTIGYPSSEPSLIKNVSGITFLANFMDSSQLSVIQQLDTFLNQDYIFEALHASPRSYPFTKSSPTVYHHLRNDIYQSVRPYVEALLNNNYKCLFYSSQLDLIVPHTTIAKFIYSLKWNGEEAYKKDVDKQIWYVQGNLAGYFKSYGPLTYLYLLKSGHIAPLDNPVVTYHLMDTFMSLKPRYVYQDNEI